MSYRAVVRNVRYWRGQVKRWSTTYHFEGTPTSALAVSDAQLVFNAHSKMLYNGGNAEGGAYQCQIYNQATGGVPIATYTLFDYTSPAAWIAPTASVWTGFGTALNAPAEGALLVEYPAGTSRTGKPVTLRKWYHQVKPVGETGSAQDVAAGDVTALQVQAQNIVGVLGAKGLSLGSGTGRFAGTALVKPFYGNHQMRRGRRRRLTTSSARAEANYGAILKIIEDQAYSGN